MSFLYIPAVLAALLFVVPPLLAHAGIIPPFVGFLVWIGSLVPAIIALVVGLKMLTSKQPALGLISIVVGLIPTSVIAYGMIASRRFPPVNDITTNLENPPHFVAAANAPENLGKDLAYPGVFHSPVRAAYPDLISLQMQLPAEEAFKLVEQVAKAQPSWRVVRDDPQTLAVEGEDTFGLFNFTDDFVIRVSPMEATSQIDMRSRSRVGQADFGANAKRIRQFFAALEAAESANRDR